MAWVPGWNSAESADNWAHVWFWFGMWCFLWLGIAEVIAFVYGLRKDHLLEAAQNSAAAQAQQQQDDLKRQLASANKKVSDLEEKDAPRHISADERKKLIEFLTGRNAGGLIIKASVSAKDARHYADEIADAIQKVPGWTVRVDNAIFPGSTATGLWVTIFSAQMAPVRAVSIHDGLTAAGLPMDPIYRIDAALGPDEVWVSVGFKN